MLVECCMRFFGIHGLFSSVNEDGRSYVCLVFEREREEGGLLVRSIFCSIRLDMS